MPVIEAAGNTSIESNASKGSQINFVARGKSVTAEFFTYAQSKTRDVETGWIPIAAEANAGKTTLIIRFSTSDPNESSPTYQAVDFDEITGSLVGIHTHNGGYKNREQIEREKASPALPILTTT